MSAFASGKPEIYNVTVGTTEVAFDSGIRVKKLMIQSRDDIATLQLAWNSGETATAYWTIKPGSVYWDDFINRSGSLYLLSDIASTPVEIQIWRST
jgi:hypothetical protein